jgi:hypothetical protein
VGVPHAFFFTAPKQTKKQHVGQRKRRFRPVHAGVEKLEHRYLLSGSGFEHDQTGELEYHAEGTNWIDFGSRGHKNILTM